MAVDSFRFILENALRLQLRKVRLTGGEPLLHPQCHEMLRIAKKELAIETVGFNTNGMLRKKLLCMVEEKLIDKLVFGVDYSDGAVSKDSNVGMPSSEILETILMAQSLGQDVTIACVYVEDYAKLERVAAWCLEHQVTLKILQVTDNRIESRLDREFIEMMENILSRFSLERGFLPNVEDYYGSSEGIPRIFFFHSHCRLRECHLCAAIHMRVTADGYIKTCIQEDVQFPLLTGSFNNSVASAISNLGHAPETRCSKDEPLVSVFSGRNLPVLSNFQPVTVVRHDK
jgi:cyclic pyranopterin phosphate synthase